jgi:hypothetical protein
MTSAQLETRPLYGIGPVARITGIRAETLRAWGRRYGLGASQKSASGHRIYTQTDLEHLQIIGRLVGQGFRIGEIAAMERKTLQAMIEQHDGVNAITVPVRPRALFLGEDLCRWLDSHPGCIAGVDSQLLRRPLAACALDDIAALEDIDLVIASCAAVDSAATDSLLKLLAASGARASLLLYQFSPERSLKLLAERDTTCARLPLKTATFAGQMKLLLGKLDINRGAGDTGELAATKARVFKASELIKIQARESALACGCSRHLAEIIQLLDGFEDYSASCSVDNWSDAATHSCVYAYTTQARWLMEKALQAVLEEHATHDH